MSTFAELHVPGRPLVLVNAWDVLSALALAESGHLAIGTTSLGITAAVGLLDGAREGREHTVALVRALSGRLPAHLSVDLENGYSDDPEAVAELVEDLARAGAVGVNLEDARRSPHEHAVVVAAVKARLPEVFVNARTDVFWTGSRDVGEALERLRRYRDAGADGLFVPGLSDQAALTRVVALGPPVNSLWQAGRDPAEVGVARISTGSMLYRQALSAVLAAGVAARDRRDPPAGATLYADTQRLLAG